MLRRHFLASPLAAAFAQRPPAKFEPDWESLRRHQVPAWYENAKLGIFIHWGLYSVPAFAPPTGELGKVDFSKWFANNPYSEWYLNTLRIEGSPTNQHHIQRYGKDFDYYRFTETFNREVMKWDPNSWASLFKDTGARYVVLTSKHHDGFQLWPSKIAHPLKPPQTLHSSRDLVGELTAAVRKQGMKMALYYSGGLDWTFEQRPVRQMADLRSTAPQTEEYGRYADAHWRELIERYQPAILWNDITYPKKSQLAQIVADYYNRFPDGLINNRFGVDFADFTTPEYARYDKITEKKWESCRGLGFSFGYNQVEDQRHVMASDKLIHMLIDITSKNGNLLLNIGPRPDGSISDIQMDRLKALGAWLKVNGEAIFDSRPWVRPSAGENVRFTRKGDSAYAFLLDRPAAKTILVPGVLAPDGMKAEMLGHAAPLSWKQQGRNIAVEAPPALPGTHAVTLKMTPAPWQVVRD